MKNNKKLYLKIVILNNEIINSNIKWKIIKSYI